MSKFYLMMAAAIFSTNLIAGTKVTLETTLGDIQLELNDEKAPLSTANFLNYVENGHYDGLIFHRVIPGFMVQAGGMDAQMKERATGKPIANESDNGLSNARGTIAMARTQNPNSATAQFYINTVNNNFLDGAPGRAGYAVFGKVIAGMDTVDKISAVETGSVSYYRDVPIQPIIIKHAVRNN
jgi:cyclophilin family peptidyl-prolyl cis-trans isomerase